MMNDMTVIMDEFDVIGITDVFILNPPLLVKSDFQKVFFSDFQNHTTTVGFLKNTLNTAPPLVKSQNFEEGGGV